MSHDRPPSEQQIHALNKIGQFIDINNIMPWLDVEVLSQKSEVISLTKPKPFHCWSVARVGNHEIY